MRWRAFTLISSLVTLALFSLLLFGCSESETPESAAPEFIFSIDPSSEMVSLEASPTTYNTTRSTVGDEPRRLLPGEELKLESFEFSFIPDNKLIIEVSFRNVTEGSEFHQPFSFKARSFNIVSSQEPVVSDDDLGGDGVLSPGETTSKLRFEVTHKNQPFFYFVQASAVVKEESSGDAPEIKSFEVDQTVVLPQDLDGDGENDPYDILHVTGPNPSFATFTKLNWEIEGGGPITLTLTATVKGEAVSAVVDTAFADGNGNVDDVDTESVALTSLEVDGNTVLLTDFEVNGDAIATKDSEDGTIPGEILDRTQNPYVFTLTASNEFGEVSTTLPLTCCQASRALMPN